MRSSSKVGTGFTESSRKSFYNFLQDNELYKDKGEIFIKPFLVIEVKFFRSRFTATPTYKFQHNQYILIGYNESVTFSHPSFQRIRKDKKSNQYDTRLEQIPGFHY